MEFTACPTASSTCLYHLLYASYSPSIMQSTSPTHSSQFYTTSSIADFVNTNTNTDPASATRYSPGPRSKTGRKTWKSLKEKKEAVWPDFLEEALLEGTYHPSHPM